MRAVFVTSNENKLREAREILGIDLRSAALDLAEPQAVSVAEVALEKSRAARAALEDPPHPILVEDSGLVFEAWNGLPGALTKWFLRSVGNEGLLKMLAAYEDRSARAVCALAVSLPDGGGEVFVGEVPGLVAPSPRGGSGFGWDPIFVPETPGGETYAELGARKNDDSHRARAFRAARAALMRG
ncbi:non-canonical purine NTP pyrophosphatase, RdgB/HAM1 family [Rubrobacter marinus]|uniref:Non-canonical purine NTP pyrophosphatase, RdgB/HAM1 family n=1 Tax=Rubrobacter marinus TaxID=2653852 RepID=A0A6G8PTW2_9ACTN|nr:non-canonical purine NTP pyrophosphatase [Rubrobacter marinus]QIN77939.1 non-canonical purine NTP pyrophosphatase, RdgB/HAM1 family [Rubrobacter marinus]